MPTLYTHICSVCDWGYSPAGLLVEFDQHATGLHVIGQIERPMTVVIFVQFAFGAISVPPSAALIRGAVLIDIHVVVTVQSTEHLSIGHVDWNCWLCNRIAGVSSVPVHRQLILANFVTDGERRVFGPVPLTVSTLDLQTATRHSGWWSGVVVSALASINEVNQRRARLVLGWVIVSGFNSRWGPFISVCDQPPRSTQSGHPFVGRRNEY